MEILLSAIVSGLLLGMVLAIVALGLTIIFGVMDMVNFAHGEYLMVGMYAGLLIAQATGLDPLFTLPAAALIGFLLGLLCYYGLAKFLLRGPMVAQLLGTFGLMLFLRNVALLLMGSEDRGIQKGILVGKSFEIGMGVVLPATKLAAAFLSVAAFVAIWLLMNRTKVGRALTATSLNAEGARYMGIRTERMNALAWGLGGATATMAGALLVNFWSVNPFVGLVVYHDRLCHRGLGRIRERSRGLFGRSGGGHHHRISGDLGFFYLYLPCQVDGEGPHDLF